MRLERHAACGGWKQVLDAVDEYSSQALRVLAIAVRTFAKMPFDADNEDVTIDQKFAIARFSAC